MKKGLMGAATAVATLLLVFAGFAPAALAEGKGGAGTANGGGGKTTASSSTDDDSAPDANGDSDNQHPSGKDRHEDKGTQGRSMSNPDGDGKGMDRTNTCGSSTTSDKPYTKTWNDGQDGAGGCDLADQDGNNGCGNDDDFEDDNNGWCGKHKTQQQPATTHAKGTGAEKPCSNEANMHGNASEDKGHGCGSSNGGTTTGTGTTAGVTGTTGTVTNTGTGPQQLPSVTAEVPTEVLGETIERPAPATAAHALASSPTELPTQAAQAARPTQVLGVTLSRGAATLARTGITVGVMLALGLGFVVAGGGLRRLGRRPADA